MNLFLSSVTAEQLSKVNIGDWLEGYGSISSLAERYYIRSYGFLLLEILNEIFNKRNEMNRLIGIITDGIDAPLNKKLKMENSQLKQDLLKFGGHQFGCPATFIRSYSCPCECGWSGVKQNVEDAKNGG